MIKEQLAKVLEQNNLGEHIHIFNHLIQDQSYTLEELKEITVEELRDLGITKITHRKIIIRLINNLSNNQILQSSSDTSSSDEILKLSLNPILMAPIREYFLEPMPKGKLLDMCHAIENFYKLVALFGVSYCAQEKKIDNELKKYLSERMKVPSLRSWIDIAEFIFERYITDKGLVKLRTYILEESASFIIPDSSENLKNPKHSFITLRNNIAHSSITSERALSLLETWHERFINFISDTQALSLLKLSTRINKKVITLTPKNMEVTLKESAKLTRKPPLELSFKSIKVKLNPFILLDHFNDEDHDLEDIKIYNRTFNRSIGFSASFSSLFKTDSDKKTLEALHKLFDYSKPQEKHFEYPDQSEKIIEKSKEIWGRDSEVETILKNVRSFKHEVSLVTGVAGSGKSAVFQRVYEELFIKDSNNESSLLVLPYQLNAVEVNESTHKFFFRYCNERIKNHFNISDEDIKTVLSEYFDGASATPQFTFLASCKFIEIKEIGSILILIDGLDEAMNACPNFVNETLLGRYYTNISINILYWLIFSREHPVFLKDLVLLKPFKIFPALPKMSPEDMRLFILNEINIPPIQKKLLEIDEDSKDGKNTKNKFIENVMQKADGYPLYVKYLIHDLRSNKFPELNIHALPSSLDAYHEKKIEELSVGDLALRKTPIIVILGLALEPLSFDEIYEIFIKVQPYHKDKQLFRQAIESISFLLERDVDPEGEEGYKLHHESLREHILSSETLQDSISILNEIFCEFSKHPYSAVHARRYFYRCGYRHLINNNLSNDLKTIFLDFVYIREMSFAFETLDFSFATSPRNNRQFMFNTKLTYFGNNIYKHPEHPGRPHKAMQGDFSMYTEDINALIIESWRKYISKRSTSAPNLYKNYLLPSWLINSTDNPLHYEFLIDFIRREYPNPEIKDLLESDIFIFIAKQLNAKKDDLVLLLLLQADYRYSEGQLKEYKKLMDKIEEVRSVDVSKAPNTEFITNLLIPQLNGEKLTISNSEIKAGVKPSEELNLRGKYFRSRFDNEELHFSRFISSNELLTRTSIALRFLQEEGATTKFLTNIIKFYTDSLLKVDIKKQGIPQSSWIGEMFLEPILSAALWLPASQIKNNQLIIESIKSIEPYIIKFHRNYPKFKFRVKTSDAVNLLELFDKFLRFNFADGTHYLFNLIQRILALKNNEISEYYWQYDSYKHLELRYQAMYEFPTFLELISEDGWWKDITYENYTPLDYKKAVANYSESNLPESLDPTSFAAKLIHILECRLFYFQSSDKNFKQAFERVYEILLDLLIFNEEQNSVPESKREVSFVSFETRLIFGCRNIFKHAERLESKALKTKSAKLFKRIISLSHSAETYPVYWAEILEYADPKS